MFESAHPCQLSDPLTSISGTGASWPASRLRRHVTRCDVGAGAEEVSLHLLGQVFPRPRIGEAQAVLVHQHRLMLEPLRPRFLGDVLVDALAQFSGIGWEV